MSTENCYYCRVLGRICEQCKTRGRRRLVREKMSADVAWFERTGHCGGCGQPAEFCLCNRNAPCGCRDLHTMGSGIAADPLEVFAAPEVSADQQELFG